MGRKSSISRLPDQVRAYIEGRLADGRMTLDELIADLQAQFPSQAEAGELPSRAAVHRYGQKLERRLAAIRASTEAAKLIRAQAGDDLDARSEALTAMIQSELFESIISLQEAGDEEMDPADRVGLLASAAKNIATLTRSSVTLKKFQAEAEQRGREKQLQEQEQRLEEMRGSDGMSEQLEQRIRDILLGESLTWPCTQRPITWAPSSRPPARRARSTWPRRWRCMASMCRRRSPRRFHPTTPSSWATSSAGSRTRVRS
ncbi:DUF3486 family protein [Pseudomonas aeruginosa]|nr:DUF3486 family protein [Pseudomonas aeruginosa]MDF6001188.1 DUF3486 family protein [Pseudomonas aeruginosa]